MKPHALLAAFALTLIPVRAEEGAWRSLLDESLSDWEVYMGVPHKTVEIPGHEKSTSEDGRTGTPLGLNQDPLKIFTTEQEDGQTVLHVSGRILAALSSKEEFENYHLSLEVKWGVKKWEPRLNARRDSGLLFHGTGAHGTFWNVWMSSLECQIQEHDMGDFIPLGGTSADVRLKEGTKDYDPSAKPVPTRDYINALLDADKPNGEWNTIEIHTIGDAAVFVVNGKPNLALTRAMFGGKPLTKGKLQIQSEAAEVYYRNIRIRTISEFPEEFRDLVSP